MRDRGDMCRRQLGVSGKSFSRVRVLLLGNSGVGKSTIVESLKCGYIRSLFRRGGATMIASQAKGTFTPERTNMLLHECHGI